jgi:hypothetical protein
MHAGPLFFGRPALVQEGRRVLKSCGSFLALLLLLLLIWFLVLSLAAVLRPRRHAIGDPETLLEIRPCPGKYGCSWPSAGWSG